MKTSVKDKITFFVAASQANLDKAKKLILDNHLHLVVGQMEHWAGGFRKVKKVVLCLKNGKPIGAGMYIETVMSCDPNIGIFVEPSHRYKGIGTEIFKRIANTTSGVIKHADGREFYQKMKPKTKQKMVKVW